MLQGLTKWGFWCRGSGFWCLLLETSQPDFRSSGLSINFKAETELKIHIDTLDHPNKRHRSASGV